MGKRANNEGSIYQRKSDGRYCGKYHDGVKTRYIYGADKEAVRVKLAKAIADRDAGFVFDSQNLTVTDYLKRWLEAIEQTLAPRTHKRHEENCRLHIAPLIGHVKLEKLTVLQVQGLYKKKVESGLHNNTVRKVHATLYKALKQAVKWQLIPRNVCEAVIAPREVRTEVSALTRDQVHKLLDAARRDKLYALYVLALSTGLRQGECLALKWDCVDFDAGTVRVKRTVWKGKVGEPKTKRSRRTVHLSQIAIRALWEHRQNQDAECEWCFPSRSGKPMDAHNFIHYRWKSIVREAGLPNATRFHDIRHTCCVLLLMDGINPRVVADQLGHADVSFTLSRYADALSSMGNGAADAMDNLLG